jgi:hypothetical protein
MRFGTFVPLAAAVCVVAGCGIAAENAHSVASPAPSAAASPSSEPNSMPSRTGRSCASLHSFVDSPILRADDPSAIDGAPAEAQEAVRKAIEAMIVLGEVELATHTGDILDEIRTIVDAVKEAEARLANGARTSEVIALLNTDAVRTARDAVAGYQGLC